MGRRSTETSIVLLAGPMFTDAAIAAAASDEPCGPADEGNRGQGGDHKAARWRSTSQHVNGGCDGRHREVEVALLRSLDRLVSCVDRRSQYVIVIRKRSLGFEMLSARPPTTSIPMPPGPCSPRRPRSVSPSGRGASVRTVVLEGERRRPVHQPCARADDDRLRSAVCEETARRQCPIGRAWSSVGPNVRW